MKAVTGKILVVLLTPLLICSCTERIPITGNSENFKPALVVEGTITNEDGPQEIIISQSSSPEAPQFIPVSGCTVYVEDEEGNQFYFTESSNEPGHYFGTINGYYIIIGERYRLGLINSEGKMYQSKYEELTACPDVGTVSWNVISKPTSDPEVTEDGVQFYVDLDADDSYGRYFRWRMEETYEYHSSFPIIRYLDEYNIMHTQYADYTYYVCYKTERTGAIAVLSTEGFRENKYNQFPILFVNDHTQRLMYGYSLLVKQYSMTKSAYQFWENLRKNNQEKTNFFGRQPANVKGNIYNVNDTSEVVLGYFGVSSVTKKRIFVDGVKELSFDEVSRCRVMVPVPGIPLPDEPRPLYFGPTIDQNGSTVWGYADTDCFICTLLGGTTEKPSFWGN